MTQKSLLSAAGDGTAVPAQAVGETLTNSPAFTATNTSTFTTLATITLTPGVWLTYAAANFDNTGNPTSSLTAFFVKGANSGTSDPVQYTTVNVAGAYQYQTFVPPQVVNIVSGDADKTVAIKVRAVAAAGLAKGYVQAIRIA